MTRRQPHHPDQSHGMARKSSTSSSDGSPHAPSNGLLPTSATQLSGNYALMDYRMQVMLLEQQNKKRLLMARQEQESYGISDRQTSPTRVDDHNSGRQRLPSQAPAPRATEYALQDYNMQKMLLEQQKKKRLLMARQEQDFRGTSDCQTCEQYRERKQVPRSTDFSTLQRAENLSSPMREHDTSAEESTDAQPSDVNVDFVQRFQQMPLDEQPRRVREAGEDQRE